MTNRGAFQPAGCEILKLDIDTLHSLYTSGQASPSDIVAQIYDRIGTSSHPCAWISLVPPETALLRAAALEAQHLGTQIFPGWLSYVLDTAVPRVVSLAISIMLYVLLFRMLPNKRLSQSVILVSAATAVVLTETMKLLFVYYMKHLSSIGTLYGTYAFFVGISLWVYYASTAFLIGAEVGWLYQERHHLPTTEPPLPHLPFAKAEVFATDSEGALEAESDAAFEEAKSN